MFWEETWAFDASDPAGTEKSSFAELSHIIWVSDVDFTTGVQIRAHLLDEGSQDLLDFILIGSLLLLMQEIELLVGLQYSRINAEVIL